MTKTVFNSNNVAGFNQTSITYSYDDADRMTKAVDTGGGSPSSPGNTQNVAYDLLDNVTSQTAPEGTVNYQYKWILPAGMTAPDQPLVCYYFDADNRLTNVIQQASGITQCPTSPGSGTLTAAVPTYDSADRPTCVQLPNSVFATYTYDADSRVTSIKYGYSLTGSCPNPPTNLGNLTYSYDADGRIIGVGGSLAAVNLPPVLSSATYNGRNQVLTWSAVSATSNQRDDLTTDPTNAAAYSWDG